MNAERLLKLAEHLESGTLGHDKFNFAVWHETCATYKDGWCGTTGCAIGECPTLWPKDWVMLKHSVPILAEYEGQTDALSNSHMTPLDCAAEWFEIEEGSAWFLFTAYTDEDYDDSGMLPPEATKEQVAAHIRQFVEDSQ